MIEISHAIVDNWPTWGVQAKLSSLRVGKRNERKSSAQVP